MASSCSPASEIDRMLYRPPSLPAAGGRYPKRAEDPGAAALFEAQVTPATLAGDAVFDTVRPRNGYVDLVGEVIFRIDVSDVLPAPGVGGRF